MSWVSVKDDLPKLDTIVIVCWPSGYDGEPIYSWGARIDDGDGWLWGVNTGRSGINIHQTPGWNEIDADDDYNVTHWMALPEAPIVSKPATE